MSACPGPSAWNGCSKLPLLTYIPVGHIDIKTCEQCQGPVRIIGCIEDPALIRQTNDHLRNRETAASRARLPPERAPSQIGLFDEADKPWSRQGMVIDYHGGWPGCPRPGQGLSGIQPGMAGCWGHSGEWKQLVSSEVWLLNEVHRSCNWTIPRLGIPIVLLVSLDHCCQTDNSL